MKTEVIPLDDTFIEVGGDGKKKQKTVFSLSGACDTTHSFLYFGVHGTSYKIEISDSDLEKLENVIKELRDARTKSAPKRVDHDRGRYRGDGR